jgi:hypothetical protein
MKPADQSHFETPPPSVQIVLRAAQVWHPVADLRPLWERLGFVTSLAHERGNMLRLLLLNITWGYIP